MIRVLEDRVINKIAAGEVVERPASIVKELVENAIDAGATVLKVELKAGAASFGCPMTARMDRQDATLCIERHATSKIRSDEDLFSVNTRFSRRGATQYRGRRALLVSRPNPTAKTRAPVSPSKVDG